jgi:hypothetical protein
VWHLRRKLALVKFPRRIQVALASRAARLVLVMPVSLESQLVLVGLAPLVLVMLVSLETPLVLVALVPQVLVALVNPVVHAVPLVQVNPVVHAVPAVQVNRVVPQVRAALVSQVDQQDRLARAGLEGQAVQAGNPVTRSHGAHNV